MAGQGQVGRNNNHHHHHDNLAAGARGRWGEDLVARAYVRAGYRIVARNWRCELGEIDLVAARDDTIVICEVKARRSDRYGPAAAAVTPAKQARLRRLAARWLADTAVSGVTVRFDVAAVTGVQLDIISAAF